jgi:hypothetical protein
MLLGLVQVPANPTNITKLPLVIGGGIELIRLVEAPASHVKVGKVTGMFVKMTTVANVESLARE